MRDESRNTDAPRRVALLMPRANAHTRGVFRGVTRYARPFRAWNFHLGLPHPDALAHLRRWRPAGIIATVTDPALERRLARLGVPMVNCSSDLAGDRVDRVVTDNARVGAMAAEHLLERGYRTLAYCGEPRSPASRARFEAFRRRATLAGAAVHPYVSRGDAPILGEAGWTASAGDRAMRQWIADLPRPAAVFACHDPMAMLLGEVCRDLGVRVPTDLAILGVDDDAMLCEMAYPTLSSVRTPQEQIGFEAARRLDELMNAPRRPKPRTVAMAPLGVATRQSTDALAAGDPLVAQAMRFIHEHADQPIRVADVVARVGVSRRTLESRFRAVTGLGVLGAIQRAHVALAGELLRGTDLTLDRIAAASGFNSRERFSSVYRQITGRTPRGRGP